MLAIINIKLKGSDFGLVVERSPLTLEIRGSNPVIGKLIEHLFTVSWVEKKKIKEKEARNGHLKNI